MYILNIASAIKKMSVNEIKDFSFENYYKQIGFSKENCYYSMKHQKKQILLATKLTTTTKKYLILVMLKNSINHLQERKIQNQ